MSCCCWKLLVKQATFLPVLPGWRDHKDHESLHQHDRKEALQREVGLQLRQQLDQVMAGGETVGKCSQALTGVPFPSVPSSNTDQSSCHNSWKILSSCSEHECCFPLCHPHTCHVPSLHTSFLTRVKFLGKSAFALVHFAPELCVCL